MHCHSSVWTLEVNLFTMKVEIPIHNCIKGKYCQILYLVKMMTKKKKLALNVMFYLNVTQQKKHIYSLT